jgi:hypothetical protein
MLDMTNTPTVKQMKERIAELCTALNYNVQFGADRLGITYSSKTAKSDVVELLKNIESMHTRRQERVQQITELGGTATIASTFKELTEMLTLLKVEQEELQKQAPVQEEETVEQQPTAEELAAADMAAEEAEYEAKKQEAAEQQRRIQATVDYINTRTGIEIATVHTPVDVLKDMATRIKATPVTPTFNRAQLDHAVQSGYQAGVEEAVARVEQPVVDNRPIVDVVAIYDAIETKAKDLIKQATQAAKDGNLALYNQLMPKYQEAMSKLSDLGKEHKDKIFSAERSKAILDKARQSIADGLRNSAEVTNKYGHCGVDGLMNLANQVLTGVVQVAQTTINVTGQVGHYAIDTVSNVQLAAADLIAPTQN